MRYFMKNVNEGAPVVVGKAYDFVLWLLPKVENFASPAYARPLANVRGSALFFRAATIREWPMALRATKGDEDRSRRAWGKVYLATGLSPSIRPSAKASSAERSTDLSN